LQCIPGTFCPLASPQGLIPLVAVDDFSALSPADPAYDSCDELFEKAFGKPRGSHVNFNWAAADDVSDSDNEQMDEIEAKMQSDWMREVERELKEVQDDAEEWFNGQ